LKNTRGAGPLIAAINSRDHHHRWACETLERLGPPFYSCPEAMAEAAAMTGRPAAIVEMIQAKEIVLAFDWSGETAGLLALLKKYRDRVRSSRFSLSCGWHLSHKAIIRQIARRNTMAHRIINE